MKHCISILLLLLLTSCAMLPQAPEAPPPAESAPALTVNGREAPLWLYEYWLRSACQQAEALYRGAGEPPDWNRTGPDSLQEQVRDQALADTALCVIVDTWAEEWGLTWTPEDQARTEQQRQAWAAAHGGEEAGLRALAEQGLTPEQARVLAETCQRYRKLHAAVQDPQNPHAPSPEVLSAFAEEEEFLSVDQIRTTGEGARQRIEALFAALNTAPDIPAAFSALALQGDATPGQVTCRRGDGTLSFVLEETGILLKPGQHSGILDTGDGFAILLCLFPDRCVLVREWLDTQLLNGVKTAEIRCFPVLSSSKVPSPIPEPTGKIH